MTRDNKHDEDSYSNDDDNMTHPSRGVWYASCHTHHLSLTTQVVMEVCVRSPGTAKAMLSRNRLGLVPGCQRIHFLTLNILKFRTSDSLSFQAPSSRSHLRSNHQKEKKKKNSKRIGTGAATVNGREKSQGLHIHNHVPLPELRTGILRHKSNRD